ncbi:MAG: hypothetical protein KAS73_08140 [Candidatus Sabulitectum sp.]|nr:hypothetical protein [Candidatus Sabulitectum sp.]
MIAIFLALALVLSGQQIDTVEEAQDGLNLGLLFHTTASADLHNGLKTLSGDTLVVFPRGAFRSDWVQLSAEAAVSYSADSTSTEIEPVSAGAFFRWPGSPWIGTGVSTGLIEPFLPGFDVPVREWRNYDMMDSSVVTIEAGGLLGFQGFWNQFGDSLSWYGVRSPWLGFGTVGWNGIREDSSLVEIFSGFLDLRKVQPWFLFVKENSQWAYLTELREMELLRNRSFTIEMVPRFYYEEDSVQIGLTGYLRGKDRAVSALLNVSVDAADGSKTFLAGGMDLLSEAGIAWSVKAELENLETFYGRVSGFYRSSPAGCGGAVEMFDDSLRATATALYTPVPGVATELSVMSNLDSNNPEPGCLLRIFGARDDFTAAVTVQWRDGLTTLGMEVSAWID